LEFSKEKLLPTGSIVVLKEGTKKLVIYGRKQILMSEENPKMYNYLGCFYPEGYINPDYTFVFNHDDISEIIFVGYIDQMKINLRNIYKNNKGYIPIKNASWWGEYYMAKKNLNG
jgi:hypothetical protein